MPRRGDRGVPGAYPGRTRGVLQQHNISAKTTMTNNNPQTIDQQLRQPGFAAYQGYKYARVASLRLDGNRIGDLPVDFGFAARYSANAAPKKVAELLAVANALASVGLREVDITPRERPDFTAKRCGGRILAIEHSDIMPSCRPDSAKYVQQEVAERVRTDPDLRNALGAYSIAITVDHAATPTTPINALTTPCPADHIGNTDARRLTDEITEFIRGLAFLGFAEDANIPFPATPATQTLIKYRAAFCVRRTDAVIQQQVAVWSHRWAPPLDSLFQAAAAALVKKQSDAAKYPIRPDWLVLNVVEQSGNFVDDLHENPAPNISPFRRVFILLWREFQLRLTVWTPQHRYQRLIA
jgi:hypothetical protein